MSKVLNCANTPVDKAIAYAQEQCSADGKSMAEYFSDFKTNYLLLQDKCELALDLPRIEMPVIEPEQMDEFQESLSKGHIDVKEPVAKAPQSKSKYPTNLGFDLRGRQWLYRGTRDGAIEDDILDAKMTEIAVADLKPSQSQIWLEKVVGMSLYFGPLKQSSEFLHEAPIIVSSDGYILDGHHRFGAAMISNPSLKLTALKVDMEIRELVKMARSYGNAIGNEQKAAESFGAESFEAEMDKVVDVDCVNIVSKKSAFTGKDRNFYRVSFRDSGQYDRFGIPAWASKAAKTMGEKYYGVSGCQMVMGMLPSGKWQIQAILVPNTEKMNKQKALKIANHMQDRIEKEGKWAKKKCREDEIIQIYQADEYEAESFNAMSFNQWSQDEMNEELHGGRNMQFKEWLDDEVHTHGNIPLKEWGYEEEHDEPEHQHAETFNADVDTETKDYWYDNIKYSWEGYGLERYQNAKLNRSMKSCVKDWLADNPNELAYMVQDNHEINEEAMDGDYKIPSKQMMKKEVAYLKSVFRKIADEMDKNGEWSKYSHKVNFDAESMMKTYKVQVKRIEGGDSQIVEIEVESDETDMESLMDEIEIAVANELQTWDFGALTVVSGPHYQMAESMARKPAYGLFGLSFITGILLNMARKD